MEQPVAEQTIIQKPKEEKKAFVPPQGKQPNVNTQQKLQTSLQLRACHSVTLDSVQNCNL